MNHKSFFVKLSSLNRLSLRSRFIRTSFYLLLVAFFFFLSVPSLNFFSQASIPASPASNTMLSTSSNLINHNPISINGNQGFSTCGCTSGGDGSSSNPFIIEDFYISGSSGSGSGISINGTTDYFIIQNVWVDGVTGYYPDDAGIHLRYVSNGLLVNNTFSHNDYGTILILSENITLINNTATSNTYTGFFSSSTNDTTYANNIASNNYRGFIVDYAHNNTFQSNQFINNSDGFDAQYSSNFTLTNNIGISNTNGIQVYYSDHFFFSHNVLNDSLGEGFYFVSSSYMNASFNSVDNAFNGFMLDSVTFGSFISNAATNNANDGFRLFGSNNFTLYNNSALYNVESGFSLFSSQYNNLSTNYAKYNVQYGLYLSSASNNYIENNLFQLNAVSNIFSSSSPGNTMINNNTTNPAVPSPPVSLQGNTTSQEVLLSWIPPTSTGGHPISTYCIYRSRFDSRSFTLIGSTTQLSFNDTSYDAFQANPFYYYVVRAVNSVGLSMYSNQVNVSVSGISPPVTSSSASSSSASSTSTTISSTTGSQPTTTTSQLDFANPMILLLSIGCFFVLRKLKIKKKK